MINTVSHAIGTNYDNANIVYVTDRFDCETHEMSAVKCVNSNDSNTTPTVYVVQGSSLNTSALQVEINDLPWTQHSYISLTKYKLTANASRIYNIHRTITSMLLDPVDNNSRVIPANHAIPKDGLVFTKCTEKRLLTQVLYCADDGTSRTEMPTFSFEYYHEARIYRDGGITNLTHIIHEGSDHIVLNGKLTVGDLLQKYYITCNSSWNIINLQPKRPDTNLVIKDDNDAYERRVNPYEGELICFGRIHQLLSNSMDTWTSNAIPVMRGNVVLCAKPHAKLDRENQVMVWNTSAQALTFAYNLGAPIVFNADDNPMHFSDSMARKLYSFFFKTDNMAWNTAIDNSCMCVDYSIKSISQLCSVLLLNHAPIKNTAAQKLTLCDLLMPLRQYMQKHPQTPLKIRDYDPHKCGLENGVYYYKVGSHMVVVMHYTEFNRSVDNITAVGSRSDIVGYRMDDLLGKSKTILLDYATKTGARKMYRNIEVGDSDDLFNTGSWKLDKNFWGDISTAVTKGLNTISKMDVISGWFQDNCIMTRRPLHSVQLNNNGDPITMEEFVASTPLEALWTDQLYGRHFVNSDKSEYSTWTSEFYKTADGTKLFISAILQSKSRLYEQLMGAKLYNLLLAFLEDFGCGNLIGDISKAKMESLISYDPKAKNLSDAFGVTINQLRIIDQVSIVKQTPVSNRVSYATTNLAITTLRHIIANSSNYDRIKFDELVKQDIAMRIDHTPTYYRAVPSLMKILQYLRSIECFVPRYNYRSNDQRLFQHAQSERDIKALDLSTFTAFLEAAESTCNHNKSSLLASAMDAGLQQRQLQSILGEAYTHKMAMNYLMKYSMAMDVMDDYLRMSKQLQQYGAVHPECIIDITAFTLRPDKSVKFIPYNEGATRIRTSNNMGRNYSSVYNNQVVSLQTYIDYMTDCFPRAILEGRVVPCFDARDTFVGCRVHLNPAETLVYLHDELGQIFTDIKDAGISEQFASAVQSEPYQDLVYSNDKFGLAIVAPTNPDDLRREGAVLSHCVGGYVNSVANGREKIYFLRRLDKLSAPYYTVDVSNEGELRQVHCYHNGNTTEADQEAAYKSSKMDVYDKTFDIIGFLQSWANAKPALNKASIKSKYGALCALR